MGKKTFFAMWVVSILVGLSIGVPATSSYIVHLKAKSLAIQGCESALFKSDPRTPESLFSEAARLDPAYIPLSTAIKVFQVDRVEARLAGYEQQWLENLSTFQGFCELSLNPSLDEK